MLTLSISHSLPMLYSHPSYADLNENFATHKVNKVYEQNLSDEMRTARDNVRNIQQWKALKLKPMF
jgi:hypothetical protein